MEMVIRSEYVCHIYSDFSDHMLRRGSMQAIIGRRGVGQMEGRRGKGEKGRGGKGGEGRV